MQAVAADRIGDMTALAADFPGWHVWRSRSCSGRETGWNATRKGHCTRTGGALPILAEADAGALRSALGQQEALTRARAA
jgi:hypothetical protein